MASALMINDRLQIDRFNPTTWTGDFGINHDGFRKDVFIDGSYTTGIDPTPVDYSDDLQNKPFDLSGNVNLKTINPNYAPHDAFPTRKYEYSDGTVTWYRPELPWGWMNGGGGARESTQFVNMKKTITERSNLIFIILIILVIGMYILKK
jgi:hypothetical protein